MSKNKVFMNNSDIIEIHVVGNQTPASVRMMGEQTAAFAEALRAAGKPVLILDDLRQMGTVPAEGRKIVVDFARDHDYDKFAMLGSDPILKFGANLLLQAIGKKDRVKYFDNPEQCLAWLLQP